MMHIGMSPHLPPYRRCLTLLMGRETYQFTSFPWILACTEGLHEVSEGGKRTFFGSRRHHIHVP